MAAPTAKERKACWDSRDQYWKCLDDNNDDQSKCQALRHCFENLCPAQWTKYFDKRRDYLKFKEQFQGGKFQPPEASQKL